MKPLSTLMQLHTLSYVDTQNGVYFHIFTHNRSCSLSYEVTELFLLPASFKNYICADPHLIHEGLSAVSIYVYP
jgi:hypothetical protein